MKTMANHHTNPYLSIISGAIAGMTAFISEHGWIIENFLELLKVISFGLIGGASGYIGKIIIMRIRKKVIEKSKHICK